MGQGGLKEERSGGTGGFAQSRDQAGQEGIVKKCETSSRPMTHIFPVICSGTHAMSCTNVCCVELLASD